MTGVTFLQGFSAPAPDAIAWHAPSERLLWTREGNAVRFISTALHQTRVDGALQRNYPLPGVFDFGLLDGARINKTLERLAITPDGRCAWLAMEAALRQDGDEPTVAAVCGPCRVAQINLTSGKMVRQTAYEPDAIPNAPSPPSANADNGVGEILMLDAHCLLVLECACMAGLTDALRNLIRLYVIDTRQGSNTLRMAALKAGNHMSAARRRVADFANYPQLARVDNIEGMCWGPTLPNGNGNGNGNGNRTLVFVSDDNFNHWQIIQFLAFNVRNPHHELHQRQHCLYRRRQHGQRHDWRAA